jgi:hypoxia up-regulated 1
VPEFLAVLSSKAQTELKTMVEKAADWLQGADGNAASTSEFTAKLSAIKKVVNPAIKRKDEAVERPERVAQFRAALDQTKSVLDQIKERQKAGAGSGSKDGSADTPPSEGSSDPMSGYTKDETTKLEAALNKAESWLEEKLKLQRKRTADQDPAFYVTDLVRPLKDLNQAVLDVAQKRLARVSTEQKAKKSSEAVKESSTKSEAKKANESKNPDSAAESSETGSETKGKKSKKHDEL